MDPGKTRDSEQIIFIYNFIPVTYFEITREDYIKRNDTKGTRTLLF